SQLEEELDVARVRVAMERATAQELRLHLHEEQQDKVQRFGVKWERCLWAKLSAAESHLQSDFNPDTCLSAIQKRVRR
ncbi:centlein, partial [Tachysurus ichikawai]